jgi:hypothetical protein
MKQCSECDPFEFIVRIIACSPVDAWSQKEFCRDAPDSRECVGSLNPSGLGVHLIEGDFAKQRLQG